MTHFLSIRQAPRLGWDYVYKCVHFYFFIFAKLFITLNTSIFDSQSSNHGKTFTIVFSETINQGQKTRDKSIWINIYKCWSLLSSQKWFWIRPQRSTQNHSQHRKHPGQMILQNLYNQKNPIHVEILKHACKQPPG